MDRRREERFESNKEARVTILGQSPASFTGRIVNASGRGLRVLVDRPIAVNAPVRVDVEGHLLLGEVCYAAPEGDGFAIGLALDQVLHEVTEVARLVDAILGESRPSPMEATPARTENLPTP